MMNFNEKIDRTESGSVKYDLRKAVFGSEDVIPLWVADMDFSTPNFIIDALRRRMEHPVFGYSFASKGYFEAIISWAKRRFGWDIEKSWIAGCSGIIPSLGVAILEFTSPGDRIIIQPPIYPPFYSAVSVNGREVVVNQLIETGGRYTMDLDDLERKADGAKMIILCNPHNPVGRVWQREELSALAEISIRYKMLIVTDDIHADIVYSPSKYIPIASLSEEIANQTITFLAPSKTFNIPGLSTSWAVSRNAELMFRFRRRLDALHLGFGNIFGSIALEEAYRNGESWLDQLLDYLSGNLAFVEEYLKEHISEISFVRPEGSYLVWLDCRRLGLSDAELKRFMISIARLGLNDGPSFGEGGSGFQRLNIGCQRSVLAEALERLSQAVKTMS